MTYTSRQLVRVYLTEAMQDPPWNADPVLLWGAGCQLGTERGSKALFRDFF